MADGGERERRDSLDYRIIREIYESDAASEVFENELEQALEANVRTIVIEPNRLGDETAHWICVGNCLHKTSVISGAACIVSGPFIPDEFSFVTLSIGFTSLVCAGVYAVSWQFDPCCKYQVEPDSTKLPQNVVHNLTSNSPVVLVRRDDRYRKFLHNSIALISTGYCAWRLYQWYTS